MAQSLKSESEQSCKMGI